MGYRTPIALVGKGRPRAAGPYSQDGQGHAEGDHGPGADPGDSQTKRENQWPHFGKSATRSAHGNRSVHRQTTNRSSMACLRWRTHTHRLTYMVMPYAKTALGNR